VGGADYILGGPIYWFMVILLVLAGMLAAFVVLHASLVARRKQLADTPASVWLWAGPQAGYLALLFVVQTPLLPLIASAVLVLLTPLALIQSIAYLLRVVFPKPAVPTDVDASAPLQDPDDSADEVEIVESDEVSW